MRRFGCRDSVCVRACVRACALQTCHSRFHFCNRPFCVMLSLVFVLSSFKVHEVNKYWEGVMVVVVMKIQIIVLWFVTPCNDVVGYQSFGGSCCLHLHGPVKPEDGGSKILRNSGILLHHYMGLKPKRPRLDSVVLLSLRQRFM